MLKLYNTLSRKKESFKPLKGKEVKLYTCGPTVYWFQHLGCFRSFVIEDVFKMLLRHEGFKVTHVRNYTDVGHLTSDADEGEDKMDVAAKREGKSPNEIANYYIKDFEETEEILGIAPPNFKCRATEHIKEIQELIKRLEQKGYTYITPNGIFFDTSKFKNYGRLAKLDLKGQKTAAREEVILDKEKRNPSDFALWFINKPTHLLQWESPWGKGYPGWHIECSAMAMKYLGDQIDVHCGGVEHISIHHTNEIAQSEAATGKQFVKYWMHINWLFFEGDKMSKSLGNIVKTKELVAKGYSSKEVRFFLLGSAHYRTSQNYSEELLKKSADQLKKINEFIERVQEFKGRKEISFEKEVKKAKKKFFKLLTDDFNIPMALNSLFEFLKKANAKIDAGKIGAKDSEAIIEVLKDIDSVFKVMTFEKEKLEIPAEVQRLVEERETARKNKDWKKADELRALIQSKGFQVLDTPEGARVKKIN